MVKRNKWFVVKVSVLLMVALTVLNFSARAAFAQPSITFVPPTPENGSVINVSWFEVNASGVATNLTHLNLTLDGVDHSVYDNSLVLYLGFNNVSAIGENTTNFVDISLYGNNGTCNITAGTCPKYTAGIFGKALSFDGLDDYVEVPDSPEFNFTASDKFSVCAWVNLPETSSWEAVVSQDDYAGWRLFVNSTSYFFGFNGTDGVYRQADAPFVHGSWQFICGEYNGTHILLYRNGDLDSAYFANATPVDPNAPVIVGATYTGASAVLRWFANGTIDEVRIYNRALSEEEIKLLYHWYLAKLNATGWDFYANITNQSDGLHTFSLTLEDNGSAVATTGTRYVIVDTKPPRIIVTSPVNMSEYSSRNVTLNVSVADVTPANITYEVDDNGTVLTLCTNCYGGSTILSNLSDGLHTVKITAVDAAGRQNETRVYFRVGATPVHFIIVDGQNTSLPVVGALITLVGNETFIPSIYSNLTNSSGMATFFVDSSQEYSVIVSKDGYRTIVLNNVVFKPGDVINLTLWGNTTINGTVLDIITKLPIKNATVRIYNASDHQLKYVVRTDDNGWFSAEIPSTMNYTVEISSTNFVTRSWYFDAGTSLNNYTFELYETGWGSFNLRVVDYQNHAPIQNATITFVLSASENFTGTTDSNGYAVVFVKANLVDGSPARYGMVIEKDGYREYENLSANLTIEEGENISLGEFELKGWYLINGTVTDEYNPSLAVSNASVELWWVNGGTPDAPVNVNGYRYNATTDESGHFEIYVPKPLLENRTFALRIDRAGYQRLDYPTNGVGLSAGEQGVFNLNIRMKGTINVKLTVKDEGNGAPVPDLPVMIKENSTEGYNYIAPATYTFHTNGNGTINVYIRGNDGYTVVVDGSSNGYQTPPPIEVNTGTDLDRVVYLKGSLQITGRVIDVNRDENGYTITLPGIRVVLCPISGSTLCYTTNTSSSGTFSVYVKGYENYRITADGSKSGYNTTTISVNSATTTFLDVGDIVLEGRCTIAGRVIDKYSKYIPEGVSPYIPNPKVIVVMNFNGKPIRYSAVGYSNGYFTIKVPAGQIASSVIIEAPGYYPYIKENVVTFNGTKTLGTISLVGTTHLKGKVVDTYNGKPLSGVSVKIYEAVNGSSELRYELTTNDSGEFNIDLGVTTKYTVELSRAGYTTASFEETPFENISRIYFMTGAGKISGEALDYYTGTPLQNFIVELYANGDTTQSPAYKLSNLHGRFTIFVDSTKCYRIKVHQYGYPVLWVGGGKCYTPPVDFSGSNAIKLRAYFETFVCDRYSYDPDSESPCYPHRPIKNADVVLYFRTNKTGNYEINGLNVTKVRIDLSTKYCSNSSAKITLTKLDGCTQAQQNHNLCVMTGTTNSTGYTSFLYVPVGKYRVTVDAVSQGCGIKEEEFNISTKNAGKLNIWKIEFVRTWLEITVTDGQYPISGVNVTLWNGSVIARNTVGDPLTAITGIDGRVVFDMMSPGTYTLTMKKTDAGIDIVRKVEVKEGNNTLVFDALPPRITDTYPKNGDIIIHGCALSPPQPLTLWAVTSEPTTANITLEKYDGTLQLPLITSNVTETNHSWELALSCGDWVWNITACDSAGNCNHTHVTFILANGTSTVAFTILDNGAAVSGANVTMWTTAGKIAENATGANLTAITGSDGRVVFTGVIPDNYNITVKNATKPVLTFVRGIYNTNYNFIVDYQRPSITAIEPKNNTKYYVACGVDKLANVTFSINTSESTNFSVDLEGVQTIHWGSQEVSNSTLFNLTLPCGKWKWNVTVCDLTGNCTNKTNLIFEIVDTSFIVNVTDEYGRPLNNISVTVSNATYAETIRTTDGLAIFGKLENNTLYNITVNGTLQGYGNAVFTNYDVIWGNVLGVSLNTTTLTVLVYDPSGNPVSGAEVKVYENSSGGWTLARDANGNPLINTTGIDGKVVFTRVLPCDYCNVTVNKTGTINSTILSIRAGEKEQVNLDPEIISGETPFEPVNSSSGERFLVILKILDEFNKTVFENVTVKLISTTTGKVYVNRTDNNGVVTFNVTSDRFDVVVDGSDMGYGILTLKRAIAIGWLKINEGKTHANGYVRLDVDGQRYYYVLVKAPGYEEYDSRDEGKVYFGTHTIGNHDTINLNGTVEVIGHVYDTYFSNPIDARKNISGADVYLYSLTGTPYVRYRFTTDSNGNFYGRISPYVEGSSIDDKSLDAYKLVVKKKGYITYTYINSTAGNSRIIFGNNEKKYFNIGMTGVGRVYVHLYDKVNGAPITDYSSFKLIDNNGAELYRNIGRKGNLLYGIYNPDYNPAHLVVEANGYCPADIPVTSFGNLINIPVYLYTYGTSQLLITVKDSLTGQPVSDAAITCYYLGTDEKVCEARTNSSGMALVTISKSGTLNIKINGTSTDHGIKMIEHVEINPCDGIKIKIINTTLIPTGAIIRTVNDLNESIDGRVRMVNTRTGRSYEVHIKNGEAIFAPVPPGNYSIDYELGPVYLPANASNYVNITSYGQLKNVISIFNETRFEVKLVDNQTSMPVRGIKVCLGTTCLFTNSDGIALFRRVIPGNYTLTFDKLSSYKAGYFPHNDVNVSVARGKNENTGNKLVINLTPTKGYSILHIRVKKIYAKNTMIYVYAGGARLYTLNTSRNGLEAFIPLTYPREAMKVKVEATHPGCGTFVFGPVDLTEQEVRDVYITFKCRSASSEGNGYGLLTTTSINGTGKFPQSKPFFALTVVPNPVEISPGGCTTGELSLENTGEKIITNVVLRSVKTSYYAINGIGRIVALLPGDREIIRYSLCVFQPVNEVTATLLSDQLTKEVTIPVTLVPETINETETKSILIEDLNELRMKLLSINRSALPPELQREYDEVQTHLQFASNYVASGNYALARNETEEARRILENLESYMASTKQNGLNKKRGISKETVILLSFIGVFGILILIYLKETGNIFKQAPSGSTSLLSKIVKGMPTGFVRRAEKNRGAYRTSSIPSGSSVRPVPRFTAENATVVVGGGTDIHPEHSDFVYFTEPVAKQEYISYLKKVIESTERCPYCGMRKVNGRCLRCD